MKFLSSLLVLFFAAVLLSCQSGVSAPDKEDYSKLEGLVTQIETQMQELRHEIEQITDYNEFLLQKRDSILASSTDFKYTMEGAFSTNLPGQDSSLSTIVILDSSSDPKKGKQLIQLTNSMDSVFAAFMHRNPKAIQIYSNSPLGASRIYPAFDAKNIVDPSLDVTEFNFYYEADLAHNPSKETVWIPEPYVDPAGKGWIFSLVHPVYEGEELSSVVGIDLSIGDAIDSYLDAVEGYFVLVNGNGDIIGGKSEAIELLGMPLLKNHVYRETIQMDNFRGADFNLSRSKNGEVRQMAKAILVDKNCYFDFVQDSRMSRVLGHAFSQVDWYLLEIKLPY
ncbi:MAG: hypothetical protein NBV61_06805 [Algoriphagus sp.]|nr:hypothetical protein [Algoriphagus sp.]